MSDVEFWSLLSVSLINFLLLLTFLLVFLKIYARIAPLADKFSSKNGEMKMPTIKQALGFAVFKMAESLDVSKVLGGFAKK